MSRVHRGQVVRWVVGVVVVAALATPVIGFGVWYVRHSQWMRLHGETRRALVALEGKRPYAVDAFVWECAVGAVITGHANVCFSRSHVSTAEMRRLRDDLNQKLAGPIDLMTIVWIWDRLGQTGPPGRRYVEQCGYLLRDCLPADSEGQPGE